MLGGCGEAHEFGRDTRPRPALENVQIDIGVSVASTPFDVSNLCHVILCTSFVDVFDATTGALKDSLLRPTNPTGRSLSCSVTNCRRSAGCTRVVASLLIVSHDAEAQKALENGAI
jgi:hypothetical protein